MTYAICFDFSDIPGEPLWAFQEGMYPFGWTPEFIYCATFNSEDEAQHALAKNYAANVAEYGRVVEVYGLDATHGAPA